MKAGLASKLKVFSFEAEMMSFSLHSHSPEQETTAAAPEEPVVAAVASQNVGGSEAPRRTDRKTGLNRRFTKSFNAIIKKKDDKEKEGIGDPFAEPPMTHKVAPVIVVVVLLFAALAVFILM